MKLEVVISDEALDFVTSVLLALTDQSKSDLTRRMIEFLVERELSHGEAENNILESLLTRVEETLLRRMFDECHQVQTKTAVRLGIDRNTLHKKLRKHNLLVAQQTEEPS